MRKLLLASVASVAGTFAMAGGAQAQPAKAPAPGTVVVHFNGNFTYQFAEVGAENNAAAGVKYASTDTVGYLRLYPGFDAMTTGGLQYGFVGELRDTAALPNGAGVNGTSSANSAGTATPSANGSVGLYIRRAYGYIGNATSGFVRFGQGDGAFSLLSYGDLEAFGDGQQWNSELGLSAITPVKVNNIFAVSGAFYTTSKITYISPSFAGFNFAVGYEPNSNGLSEGVSALSSESSIAGGSNNRRRNTIDAMVGYSTTMDGVGVKASAGYFDASPLGDTTTAQPYKNMGIAQFGGQVAFAGAVVGANYKYGSVNDGLAFKTAGQRNDSDFLVSGTYTMGPVILGASYFLNQSAGAHTAITPTIAKTETTDGLAVGANYAVSPNLNLFTQYLYGQIHQPGATFKDGTNLAVGGKGKYHTNAISVGATVKW